MYVHALVSDLAEVKDSQIPLCIDSITVMMRLKSAPIPISAFILISAAILIIISQRRQSTC